MLHPTEANALARSRAAGKRPALELGREARVAADDHGAVRLWLRLLTCSAQIERELRRRLHRRFGITLARFDYLAQLERHPQGLRMSELSACLMVTGGNVTGLTRQLVDIGQVEQRPDPDDGRSHRVRLTPAGRAAFLTMAQEHEAWVVELLGGFDEAAREQLHALLGQLRQHVAPATDEPRRSAPAAADAAPHGGTRP